MFGEQLIERFPFSAFVSKTVTLEPRQGNPPPRLWELAGGMINSIGLPNKGLQVYLAKDLPKLAELPVPLIVNVMGFSRDEVAELVSAFAERDEVAALELNVSCPNVETGLVMGADPRELALLLERVSAADRQAADRQADSERLRRRRRRPRRGAGGRERALADQHDPRDGAAPADGRAVARGRRPVASPVRRSAPSRSPRCRRWRARSRFPIVGMGGVQSGRDALDLMRVGADIVAVGTESFRDPARRPSDHLRVARTAC